MANDFTVPGVLRMDTAAVVSTTLKFKISHIRLVPGAAAATAEFRNGADQIIAQLAAAANGNSDEVWFTPPRIFTGLELKTIAGAGAQAYVYCE